MRRFSQLAIPYAVWVALMILLPMLLILLYAFTTQGNDIVNFSFTLDHFIRFFTDQDFLLILWRSLVIAFKTTIICVLLGYPIAYFIARSSDKVRNILVLVITLPMWINMLVRTYAWIGILSDGGILQNILSFLGFGEPELLYTEGAVLLGMVYNFLPFMILQDGQIAAGSERRSGCQPVSDVLAGHLPAVAFRGHQRHHAGVPAGGELILHSEAVGRRTVLPDRKRDRESVHHGRGMELRQRDLHDHGRGHDAVHVPDPPCG